MGLITHTIRSLINGVSQQVPSIRLDNQVEEQLNMVPDVSIGLTRRNPVALRDIIETTSNQSSINPDDFLFSYSHGDQIRHMGVTTTGVVYRFDSDFEESTVDYSATQSYLAHTGPNDLAVVETPDKVFILNRNKTVGTVSTGVPTTQAPRIMAWVTAATNTVTYKLELFGVDSSNNKTSLATSTYTACSSSTPNSVISNLSTNLTHADINNKYVKQNSLLVDFSGSYDSYMIEASNDAGYNAVYAVTEAIVTNTYFMSSASKLPNVIDTTDTPFIVRIQPDSNKNTTAYYLRYNPINMSWVEEPLSFVDTIDPQTLPVVINKDHPTDIDIIYNNWQTREAGDGNSNKDPSFVGTNIIDILIYNSRLGVATENTLVFSEIDNYDNFYRTTASQTLTGDRVDIELDSTRLGYRPIKNVFSLNGKLFMNTGETQSVLTVPSTLDLTKAAFTNVSAHALGEESPLPFRRSMYFPVSRGGFGNLVEFAVDNVTGIGYTGEVVTRHCERYIKGDILQMVYTNDVLAVRTSDDPTALYIQHTFIDKGKIAQNAWHKWSFEFPIKYMHTTNNNLELVCVPSGEDKVVYGDMKLIPQIISEDDESGAFVTLSIGYTPYMDFYTNSMALTAKLPNGYTSINSTTGAIELHIDSTQQSGYYFESSVKLSKQVARIAGDGGTEKLGFAKMMLRRMVGTLGLSGRFNIEVEKTGRPISVFKHVPKTLSGLIIGRDVISTSPLNFVVNGRAEDVEITFKTDQSFAPLNILSLEYQAQLITRGSRI